MKVWITEKWDMEEPGGSKGVAKKLGCTLEKALEKITVQFETYKKEFPAQRSALIGLTGKSSGRPYDKVIEINQ